MKRFLTSKSFLITFILFSLLYIVNLTAAPGASVIDIALSILTCILAGFISGFMIGRVIFLVLKKKTAL